MPTQHVKTKSSPLDSLERTVPIGRVNVLRFRKTALLQKATSSPSPATTPPPSALSHTSPRRDHVWDNASKPQAGAPQVWTMLARKQPTPTSRATRTHITSLVTQNLLPDGSLRTPIDWELATLVRFDIVGFTTICSTLSSEESHDMLLRLYDKIDGMLRFYGIDKIDIVGDAYYALSYRPNKHATNGICFGLHAMEIAKCTPILLTDLARGNLSIRVAVHSGPVVLIALHSAAFKYSLIGDTFKCVTELETTCELNTIHVSETPAALVPPELHFQFARRTPYSFSVTHLWHNETIICSTTLNVIHVSEFTLHWLQFARDEFRSLRMILGPTTHSTQVGVNIKQCLNGRRTVYLDTDVYNRAGDAIHVTMLMSHSDTSPTEFRLCLKPLSWTTMLSKGDDGADLFDAATL